MSVTSTKAIVIGVVLLSCLIASPQASPQTDLSAANSQTQSLDQLLEQTRRAAAETQRIDAERERQFRQQVDQQQRLLNEAAAELAAEKSRGDQLAAEFANNEKGLAELAAVLAERSGNLTEMSGVVKQAANDLKGKIDDSLVSAQYPGRQQFLGELARRKQLPNIEQLSKLWYELQRELTEQGKVVKFSADILRPGGDIQAAQAVTRVGVFSAVSGGKFLQWQAPNTAQQAGVLAELSRQPASRFVGLIDDFEQASTGSKPLALDFTRGIILGRVVKTKTWSERLGLGGGGLRDSDAGPIGWVIIGLGLLGLALCLFRGVGLTLASRSIRQQLHKSNADSGNALGRVMSVYSDGHDVDVETLELQLDEAILRETGPLESGLSFIKMLYVIAPLLGLLGTVVGMIATFQQITLFGTGDPKNMAGGISQALVTTVLGLCVAIPLTFLHSMLHSRSRRLIQILEQQSAGIVARLAERRDGVAL